MKAISLWQPWASLLVAGIKKIETRHWPASYRGPLLIHAARHFDEKGYRQMACDPSFAAAVSMLGDGSALGFLESTELYKTLPFGAIVGQVNLVDCRKTESFSYSNGDFPISEHPPQDYYRIDRLLWDEKVLGDFSPGRYGWVCTDPVKFANAIPYKGSQGFFEVDEALIKWMRL